MLSWLQSTKDVHALIARGSYGKAAKILESHVKREPESVHLRQLLADVLARDGQKERAVEILHRLVDHFATEGFVAKAIAVLKKIQRIDPEATDTSEKLAALLKQAEAEAAPRPAAAPMPPAAAPIAEPSETLLLTSELVLSEVWFEKASASRDDFHWSPLFSDLSRRELAAVIGGLRLLVKHAGSIIFTEGEPGDSLYVLSTGKARVYRRDPRGHNHQIALLQEGEFFGEACLVADEVRTATITAATECELLELDRATFERIAGSNPRVRRLVQEFHDERQRHRPAAK